MSENKSTESETPAAVAGGAPCSAFPSASEFRTAAKVIRYICDKSDEMQQKLPLLEKLWWKLTRENNDELRRKSAVIESIADRLDTPSRPSSATAAGDGGRLQTKLPNKPETINRPAGRQRPG